LLKKCQKCLIVMRKNFKTHLAITLQNWHLKNDINLLLSALRKLHFEACEGLYTNNLLK